MMRMITNDEDEDKWWGWGQKEGDIVIVNVNKKSFPRYSLRAAGNVWVYLNSRPIPHQARILKE